LAWFELGGFKGFGKIRAKLQTSLSWGEMEWGVYLGAKIQSSTNCELSII